MSEYDDLIERAAAQFAGAIIDPTPEREARLWDTIEAALRLRSGHPGDLAVRFKWRPRLEVEIMKLNVLQQRKPRLGSEWADRALFIWLYRRYPRILDPVTVVRPETVVRWHRMGFAAYWRWKSRPDGGRPCVMGL
jgi:hypothetical protein